MSNRHNISVFGQNTGMILDSAQLSQPFIFIRMIKKKRDGTWEKPSNQEGKAIKLGLHELCSVNQVLQRQKPEKQLYHKFNDTETRIIFKWETQKRQTLHISIGDYFKPVKEGHLELFMRLIAHIIDEKIKYATVRQQQEEQSNKST